MRRQRRNRADRIMESDNTARDREPPVPALEDEDVPEQFASDGDQVVQYIFPVEIEVRTAPNQVESSKIVDDVLDRVGQMLENI